MNVLVTGSAGFLGKNLVENLKNIRDGKNKTRPALQIDEIYEYDINSTAEELEEYCEKASFIFHCAGVNRPKEASEFMKGNFGFTSQLLNMLKQKGNKAPIVITSSVQATLSGRFGDSEYGRSKLAGEELMFSYSKETASPVYIYRFPNLVGKWGRPSYNSATITFCYNIARDLPITVNDPSVELELLFVEDLLEEFYDCMEGHPHHCHFDGVEAVADPDGQYCYCPVTHKATLGQIVVLLHTFHDQPASLIMPSMAPGSFEKKLFSMYLSYLPEEKTCVDLNGSFDSRGSFTEVWKSLDHGQFSINVSNPGQTKGEHWHNSKWEIFIVVSGHGLIQERKIGINPETGKEYDIREFEVCGEEMRAVIMLPGYTHKIVNLEKDRDLVTVMWANESFDPNHPDTFREEV